MNDDKKTLTINLRIADVPLSLNILWEDEEYYREAAKRIDNLLNLYRESFKEQDAANYLVMVALHLSVAAVRLERKNDTQPFKDKIEELTRTLENYLKEEK